MRSKLRGVAAVLSQEPWANSVLRELLWEMNAACYASRCPSPLPKVM